MTDEHSGHHHFENRLLAALSPETWSLFAPMLEDISAPLGKVLLEAGEPIQHVFFPRSGMISLLVATSDGELIETATVGREGGVGLQRALGQRRSFTRATVQIRGTMSVIKAHSFEKIARDHSPVRDMVSSYIEVMWAEAQQVAACNVIHHASARLCRWLLQTSDRIGSDQLGLTQEFLAQMLGVRRTTVTLLAQSLQKDGLISYSRGNIQILDRRRLEACACECYSAIQELPSKLGVAT